MVLYKHILRSGIILGAALFAVGLVLITGGFVLLITLLDLSHRCDKPEWPSSWDREINMFFKKFK